MKHYFSAAEYIKERKFPLQVPAYYNPFIPESMVNKTPQPLEKVNTLRMVGTRRCAGPMPRMLDDPDMLQRADYSIEIMVDMFKRKVVFHLMQSFDIVEILDGIDRYLLSLQHDVESGDERAIAYGKLMIAFREEIYKHYFRYMKTNPTALAKLYPNENLNKNFHTLLSAFSHGREDLQNLDPLKAKAFPPYTIEDPKDSKVDTFDANADTEISLGISAANKLLSDDGKSFDFEDFLKRGT